MAFPFEVDAAELSDQIDDLVDAVWNSLQSNFLTLPKGPGFASYDRFADAYDVLHQSTGGFHDWRLEAIWEAFEADALVFTVVRTILGLSPPEWAHLASTSRGIVITQNQARTLDRLGRKVSSKSMSPARADMIRAMFDTAVDILSAPVTGTPDALIHRLDKADTREGLTSLRHTAQLGVPYAMLLYERFLGRPFASHRDGISEQVGDVMETAVESELAKAHITYRKTKRAERVPGFAQAPDFIVPDEWRPRVVIEAKITEDDGTARDKVTRIIRLSHMAQERATEGEAPFQVVACIDGRGFGIRREDMRSLIAATNGKVFTLSALSHLVAMTDLRLYGSSL